MATGIPDVMTTAKRLASVKASSPAPAGWCRVSVRLSADNRELLIREAADACIRDGRVRVSIDAFIANIVDEWCEKRRSKR